MNYLKKYAQLLVRYSLSVKPGERVYIESTTLAEPLLREVQREVLRAGGLPYFNIQFRDQERILLEEGQGEQLAADPIYAQAMQEFEAYLHIRAPFWSRDLRTATPNEARKQRHAALAPYRQAYNERTATLSLKRCLCEYPTLAHAENAGMSLEDYEQFIYHACFLDRENPQAEWEALSRRQQRIADKFNTCSEFHYKAQGMDLTFSAKDRFWINSDGHTNMPSGEVFTAPVEDSVNGVVRFSFPSVYAGQDVEGITLWVKDGEIYRWEAEKGQDLLDQIFQIEGARRFGEAAVGCNPHIQERVRNILFDEKIGGTIHLAIGQSYLQNGGKNNSIIHWDMITDMGQDGEIWADGELIYRGGEFLF